MLINLFSTFFSDLFSLEGPLARVAQLSLHTVLYFLGLWYSYLYYYVMSATRRRTTRPRTTPYVVLTWWIRTMLLALLISPWYLWRHLWMVLGVYGFALLQGMLVVRFILP